jgi:phage-related tail fiber protein
MKMDFEQYARQLRAGAGGQALEALTQSETGTKLAAQVDVKSLEAAAKAGDGQALAKLLQGVLATPEGQDFARQVQKAVGQDGR